MLPNRDFRDPMAGLRTGHGVFFCPGKNSAVHVLDGAVFVMCKVIVFCWAYN